MCTGLAALIVRRQQNDGKGNLTVDLDLLDDRSALVCLLVQNDWLEVESLEESATASRTPSSWPCTTKTRRLSLDGDRNSLGTVGNGSGTRYSLLSRGWPAAAIGWMPVCLRSDIVAPRDVPGNLPAPCPPSIWSDAERTAIQSGSTSVPVVFNGICAENIAKRFLDCRLQYGYFGENASGLIQGQTHQGPRYEPRCAEFHASCHRQLKRRF